MEMGKMAERVRQLERMRQTVRYMDEAMQCLTPEERLALEVLVIDQERHGADRLCQQLGVERSSVYRCRDRALRKLQRILDGRT